MVRSTAFEATVVGLLAALASFCAIQASGDDSYTVVAQSTPATAGSGRRPLSARIVSGRLPLRTVAPAAAETPEPAAAPSVDVSREVTLQRVRQVLSATAAADMAPPTDGESGVLQSPPLAGVPAPARLEFDVRESRTYISEGERVIVNIAVRNIGPTPARQVETALFFADGVEPVKTTGHGAAIAAGAVRLEPIASLAPGDSVILAVTAVGVRPGSVIYRGELACAELPGVLAREGALRVEPRGEAPLTVPTESD